MHHEHSPLPRQERERPVAWFSGPDKDRSLRPDKVSGGWIGSAAALRTGNETARRRQAATPACSAPGQELGSEELSQRFCSPTWHNVPPLRSQPPASLWEGADIYPGQTLSLWESYFSSSSAGHLAWGRGTAGCPWTSCPPGPA